MMIASRVVLSPDVRNFERVRDVRKSRRFSLCLHVDVATQLLDSRLHIFHHVVEGAVKGDWSVFVIQLDEKICVNEIVRTRSGLFHVF